MFRSERSINPEEVQDIINDINDKIRIEIKPDYILITNFFRDQLDRYGEVENTIKKVQYFKLVKKSNLPLTEKRK